MDFATFFPVIHIFKYFHLFYRMVEDWLFPQAKVMMDGKMLCCEIGE